MPSSLPSCLRSPTIPARDVRKIFSALFLGDWSMSSFRNFALDFRLGATLAVALSCSLLPTAGHAYTQEEQQACQPDAFRLCSSEIPDVDRVTACMIANRSQLSPECRQFFRAGPEADAAAARPAAVGKPMSIKPATTHKTKAPAKPKPRPKPRPSRKRRPSPTQPDSCACRRATGLVLFTSELPRDRKLRDACLLALSKIGSPITASTRRRARVERPLDLERRESVRP